MRWADLSVVVFEMVNKTCYSKRNKLKSEMNQIRRSEGKRCTLLHNIHVRSACEPNGIEQQHAYQMPVETGKNHTPHISFERQSKQIMDEKE